MRPETEARIRSVQRFGKNARQFCKLAGAFVGIVLFASWGVILAAPRVSANFKLGLGFYDVMPAQLTTTPIKVWALIVVTAVLGLMIWMLLHLYRLFRHLEEGSIYTVQNVYHLRQVGWLLMALAVLKLLVPFVSLALAEISLMNSAFTVAFSDGDVGLTFGDFITASLVLLASWIMDVGRQVSDDADAMRREADLVI
jgi:hypothetical protein